MKESYKLLHQHSLGKFSVLFTSVVPILFSQIDLPKNEFLLYFFDIYAIIVLNKK